MKNPLLAGFFVFFFTLFLSLFMFTWQIKVLTSPSLFISALSSSHIYDRLPALADQLEPNDKTNLNLVAIIKTFAASIDPKVVQTETEKFITDFMSYLTNKSDNLDIKYNIKSMKDKFIAHWPVLAPKIYTEEYSKLPKCGANTTDLQTQPEAGTLNCQSDTLKTTDMAALIQSADIAGISRTIPDEIDMKETFQKNIQSIEKIRSTFKILNFLYILSLVLMLLSLVLIIVSVYPDTRSLARKIGWPMLIICGPIVLFDIFSGQTIDFLKNFMTDTTAIQVSALVNPVFNVINQKIVDATIKIPLIFALGGVLLLIVSIFIPKNDPRIVPPGFENKNI